MNFTESKKLQDKSHSIVPGGCHTYAKGDDQYPVLAPGFIERGKGCHIWDPDGNEYIEYGMGCRAVTLGHAYPEVLEAAQLQMRRGINFVRPSPIEVECAEALLTLIDGADMVKFTKDGSSATTAAVKLARAHTGRDLIALCGDHPFFSSDDWFIGTTTMDAGIPEAVKNLSLTFRFGDIESVREIFDKHPGKIAGLIMEPRGDDENETKIFLQEVHRLCRENSTVFILDEILTGFRWHEKGAQHLYKVVPDLSTFGKAFANGFSVSALAGKREIMELGGLDHDRKRVFLLSSTHGAENHALGAAIATMRIYQKKPVVETLHKRGKRLSTGITQIVEAHGLDDYVQIYGRPCMLFFAARDQERKRSQSFRSLLLQETVRRGVLMPSLTVSYSHSNEDIDKTIDAVDKALPVYKAALEGGVDRFLVGRPSQIVFSKRTSQP